MTMFEKISEVCPDGFDSYEFVSEVIGWPTVPEYVDDEKSEVEMEHLDTENFFVKELADEYIIVVAGGDWQDPLEVMIHLIDNKLVVTKVSTPEYYDDEDSVYLP